jgi:ribosomal protein S18 acetylase RimI-like enzyme
LKPVDPERGYARWFATQLDEEDMLLLVAEVCGSGPSTGGAGEEEDESSESGVVGYVYAKMEPRSYNELLDACTKLHDIYVDERARGKGVGALLLRETFRRAAEKGAPRIVLLTAAQNEAAQRLFKRAGFRTTMLELTRELLPEDREADPTSSGDAKAGADR